MEERSRLITRELLVLISLLMNQIASSSRRSTMLDVAALSAADALGKFFRINNIEVAPNQTPALRALKEKVSFMSVIKG